MGSKMKGKIAAVIFLLNFTSFLALSAQWAKTYGTEEDEHANIIKKTNDGGYIIAGKTGQKTYKNNRYVPPGQDVWIIKITFDGDIEWQKIYEEYGTDDVHFIQQTNDGGYIFGGFLLVSGFGSFAIIKISPNGDIEWERNYGGLSTATAYSLQQTSDGGYIVAGDYWFSGSDILILKLFFDGTVEWSKTYGGIENDKPSVILQTNDGGYIVAGETNSYGAGNSDIWILKLTSDGMIEWQKTYGGSESEYASSIQKTNDGGYIVACSIISFGAGQADFWIIKITSEGVIEWNKSYGGSKSETAYSIQQTFDGGFVVAGETQSFGAGKKDIWIIKLNIWGDIEWEKTYGGSQDEEASSIQQTNDGGYIIAGSTGTYGVGGRDFLILRLSSNGDISSACTFINESNAEIANTDINPSDTYIDTEFQEILPIDINVTPRESEAVVYSLCSGQHTLSITASSGGNTEPSPGTHIYDYAERINIKAVPDTGYKFTGWSGDVSEEKELIFITMDSDKSLQANFKLNVLDEIWERVKRTPCFIATAAYGSPIHPHVKTLQDFRDKFLISSKLGRRLVNIYYKYSPRIADIITKHKSLRIVLRLWLLPAVALGYSMVHFGPVITTLMLLLTLIAPFFFVWFCRRKARKK